MQLAVIETGTPAEPLRAEFGGYFEMFQNAFAMIDVDDLHMQNFPVYKNGALPDVAQFDGVIISGSPFGVYEDHAFIPSLEMFIRNSLETGTAIAGICFGHQIMAKAMGGHVEKVTKGWGVGVHTYEISPSMELSGQAGYFSEMFMGQETLSCLLSHQDQVVGLSPNITNLGGSAFCPNGILGYADGKGVSFQMHPEFEVDFAAALLNSRRDKIATATVTEAETSFTAPSDRLVMLQMLIDFFKYHQQN